MTDYRSPILRRIGPGEIAATRVDPLDDKTRADAATILADVKARGDAAVREHAERLGDLKPGAPLVLGKRELDDALASLPEGDRALLIRTAERIQRFADAQKRTLKGLDVEVEGGRAGHFVRPMKTAGCYAPGGRFPLPSSVLMTAVTARVAGVSDVWVASPRPTVVTLAAAAVAKADALLTVGGAQAIAAFAYGAGIMERRDVIAGPGNRWVTAAKHLVSGSVAIDMLAGPSELVIIADETAQPQVVAADLLAQAEHDDDALPVLITPSRELADAVDLALAEQLATLPTAATARTALANGFCVITGDLNEAAHASDLLAPEHLELQVHDPARLRDKVTAYGALFIGTAAAEVFGDYGVGPNHVLPTSGSARHTGGLSVLTFMRVRTWLAMDGAPGDLIDDVTRLARLEGLEAHARAAEKRR